jgi:hypothetical protein
MQVDDARPFVVSEDLGSRNESDINNSVDHPTTGSTVQGNSNNSEVNENKPLLRIYLHPYYVWSRYMIYPVRYQKKIPNENMSANFYSEQVDEWVTKIWPHLRDIVLHDDEIQDIRNERIRICWIAWVLSGILVFMFPESNHYILIAIGSVIMIYAIAKYIQLGDPGITSLNPQRKAILLNIIIIIVLNLIVFLFSIVWLNKKHYDELFAISLPVFTSLYLFIFTSCRDGVLFFSFERQDKALKSLYYQVKLFGGTLTYFTLYPRIRFFNGDIAIDVYPKIDQPNTNDTDLPQVLCPLEMSDNASCEISTAESKFGMNDPLLTRDHVSSTFDVQM